MIRALLTIAVDGMSVDPLGVKEAVSMALEPLGGVRVLQVDVHEPEQLGLERVIPAQPARPAGQAPSTDGRKAPQKAKWQGMACCLSCGYYRQSGGRNEMGRLYWGVCGRSGRPVYDLKERCAAWKGRNGS